MYPFWDVAVAPVLDAAGVRRVVEIGALRGENTVKMLERLGPDCELHVIDPLPSFDPAEHESVFGGRYVFHEALSLDVLPSLPPMDAALIDGDHNWYTVYHELRALAEVSRAANRPLPLLFLHDVDWPYGRRDLYYAPEQIPEEFRQPYRKAGVRIGMRKLFERGSINPDMNNAELEGGPRNGVMTAVDDFIAEYDRPLRLVFVPTYFGLAIVAEQQYLDLHPEVAAAIDRVESAEGRLELMKMTENARLRALRLEHHNGQKHADALARGRGRNLELLKRALLNDLYLEHEVVLSHVTDRAAIGQPPFVDRLRDPQRHDVAALRHARDQRTGPGGPDAEAARSFLPFTAMGRPRLDHLERSLDKVLADEVEGDLLECGTARGGGAIFMRSYLDIHERPDRTVWVVDEFRSSPRPDLAPELKADGIAGFRADLNLVRDGFERFGVLDDRVRFVQGRPSETLAEAEVRALALLRIGWSAAGSARAVLDQLYDRIAEGGFVLVEDDADHLNRADVDSFRRDRGLTGILEQVDGGAIAWRKESPADPAPRPVDHANASPPLAAPASNDPLDLSVVVVFYNMQREAERTLRSLSRAYQRDIDDLRYEVIAVENGSADGQKLGPEFVASFGEEFRYVDMGDDARPSPIAALNHGMNLARGENLAFMIDGAHVLTPGVLRFGMDGLRTYAPAVVATQQWYVGPGQQGDAMDDGYDQDYEDRLFETIAWPHDGYRLFEIGHFIGPRDWFDGLSESNCVFTPREIVAQVGGFDADFAMPGGGYANLEFWERLASAPGVAVTTILGEGSFHQVHGGTTTNQPDADTRRARIFGYSEHFADHKGRSFRGASKPIHYVGQIHTSSARRTKARRLTADAFAEGAAMLESDKRPDKPTPVPDDLRTSFTEAVWRSLPWEHTSWLGRRVTTAPTDLLAYQEAIATVRPDWIIETGTGDGGRTLFLASICDLIDHGRVVSVDAQLAEGLPEHPRIRYQRGNAHQAVTVERVVADIEPDSSVMVIIGTCADRFQTTKQFEQYAPLVTVGSYAVITDTIVNGNPVWPGFGAGPAESIKQILPRFGDFVADPEMEKYSLTFNPNGFLRRGK